MLLIVEERTVVRDAYIASFHTMGHKLEGFSTQGFLEWFGSAPKSDWEAVEAVIFGECREPERLTKLVAKSARVPVLLLSEGLNLEVILALFEAGVDDVLRKPVNVREIICRINAARRRIGGAGTERPDMKLQVFFDGRDPIVAGTTLVLPRRERRILEYFVVNAGKRLSKEQLFNAVYGIFEEGVCDVVVESHICKLRKKLKESLGYDPIDSKRYLGYCFQLRQPLAHSAQSSSQHEMLHDVLLSI